MEKFLRDGEVVITNFMHQIFLVAPENTSIHPPFYCSPPPIKDNLSFH